MEEIREEVGWEIERERGRKEIRRLGREEGREGEDGEKSKSS